MYIEKMVHLSDDDQSRLIVNVRVSAEVYCDKKKIGTAYLHQYAAANGDGDGDGDSYLHLDFHMGEECTDATDKIAKLVNDKLRKLVSGFHIPTPCPPVNNK